DLGVAANAPLRDVAAGDGADAADLERVADHGPAQVDDLLLGLELALQGSAEIVGQVIDDIVLANLYVVFLGESAGPVVGHGIEADDHRVLRRGQREPDVALGNMPDAGLQHAHAHFLVVQLFQLLADRLDRAAEVGLEDDLELGDLRLAEAFQRDRRPRRLGGFLGPVLALLGDLAGQAEVG